MTERTDKQQLLENTAWNPKAYVTNCGELLSVEGMMSAYPECADDLQTMQVIVNEILYGLTYGHLVNKGGNG